VYATVPITITDTGKGTKLTLERKGSHGFTLEFFRLRDKAVGVEVLEVKERVLDLTWEPGAFSTRFALVLESPTNASRYTLSFYELGEKGPPTLLLSLEDKMYNQVHWSPAGIGHVLMINTVSSSSAGTMEFFDVEHKRSFAVAEHSQCTEVAWDPSGRLLASWKAQPLTREPSTRETVQNGFILWSFQGAKVFETERHKVFQFMWRPRPAG
jgi:translation initiation factor 3 subunit B